MAVYEQTYRRYDGPLLSGFQRFWVIPRYAWKRLASSKLVVILLVLAAISTLGAATIIYLPHNLRVIETMGIDVAGLIPIDPRFFRFWLGLQLLWSFLFVLIAGPRLISMDTSNGALPLYLARPLDRKEYVLGKLSVLAVVISLMTWVPGLLLFALQGALDNAWIGENLRIAAAVFGGSWLWILWVGFVTLGLSALLRWPLAVRGALLVMYFVLFPFSFMLAEVMRSPQGHLIHIFGDLGHVLDALFGVHQLYGGAWSDVSVTGAATVLAVTFALALLVLVKKLRAYEVVS